jgi:ParB family chromosome partitioning protein
LSHLNPLVENVDIWKISAPIYQIRSELEDEDLVNSIKENGLLQPILVRVAGDRFQVVAGQRRLNACRRLGLRSIAAKIIEADDKEAFKISLIENIERKTLNPLEEAMAFKKYVDDFGFGGMTELAKEIGRSVTYVSRRVALLQLPKEVQQKVLRRRKGLSAAIELLSIGDAEEAMEMAGRIDSLNLTQRETREVVRRRRKERAASSYYSEQNEELRAAVGAVDRCITSLRLGLLRIDDAVDSVEKDWFVREVLFQYRVSLHDQIDSLIRFKRKMKTISSADSRSLPRKGGVAVRPKQEG